MDTFLRVIAVLIEVGLLGIVFYSILAGVRLILFDLGIKQQHNKIVTIFLAAAGCLFLVFLFSHLFTFYPII
ncbi:MAG: hypothetical protein WC333_03875 [Dehalococcoidia bacterium]|jgi:succinate dehydrogenase/fumarate reductase cytochrome b subunit